MVHNKVVPTEGPMVAGHTAVGVQEKGEPYYLKKEAGFGREEDWNDLKEDVGVRRGRKSGRTGDGRTGDRQVMDRAQAEPRLLSSLWDGRCSLHWHHSYNVPSAPLQHGLLQTEIKLYLPTHIKNLP